MSRKTGSVICRDERRLYGILPRMPGLNVGYARVSTDQQDLTALATTRRYIRQESPPAAEEPGRLS